VRTIAAGYIFGPSPREQRNPLGIANREMDHEIGFNIGLVRCWRSFCEGGEDGGHG
jgi:hypothetical protein